VNPNGQSTTWYVEYGKDTTYGTKTSPADAGSGTTGTDVSTTITGLTPATTYHYRFVATNVTGPTQGGDGVFTTAALPPPDVVTSAATVSGTTATLNGTVDANGRPTNWHFEYGTTTTYGTSTPTQNGGSGTTPIAVSAPISGLKAGATYHFRLVATSDGGTSNGNDQTFSIAGSPPGVTTTAATGVSASAATLHGTLQPNSQTTSYHFEFGTTTSYGSVTATRSAGSGSASVSVSAALSSLASSTTFHYRLVATNSSGTTNGADQTFTTVAAAPTAVTGSAQNVGATTATLTGSVDPRGLATSWYFEYGTTTKYGSRTATVNTGVGSGLRGVSAAVLGLTGGGTYHFRLVASSTAGTTRGSDGTFKTTAASVTVSQAASVTTYGQAVTLSGSVSSGQSGVTVSILSQPFGRTSFTSIATVKTTTGGAWSYAARPGIYTSYQASASGAASSPVSIAVRPAVSLNVVRSTKLATHVSASKSFAGRIVQLQRRSGGRWVTLRRARLNATSSTTFGSGLLPHGRSSIRIAMSVNQAGAGYLAGLSRTIVFTRR
jgi:hypothetical protein